MPCAVPLVSLSISSLSMYLFTCFCYHFSVLYLYPYLSQSSTLLHRVTIRSPHPPKLPSPHNNPKASHAGLTGPCFFRDRRSTSNARCQSVWFFLPIAIGKAASSSDNMQMLWQAWYILPKSFLGELGMWRRCVIRRSALFRSVVASDCLLPHWHSCAGCSPPL